MDDASRHQEGRATRVRSGEVELAVRQWGQPTPGRPTLVLVHGYPDCSDVWDGVVTHLAPRFHVVAYDVRGAGASTAPARTLGYAIDRLMEDLGCVLDAVAPEGRVHLLCHDWGSIQCWDAVAVETPNLSTRIASFTSISGPSLDHAAHWVRRRLRSSSPRLLGQALRQFARSWYMAAFQLPLLAPAVWRLGLDRRWPALLARNDGVRVAPSPTRRQDGMRGVGLYRANVFRRLLRPAQRRVDLPVQVLVPRRDPYMVREIWDDLPQWVSRLWRREIDAGHWLPLSQPQRVAQCVTEFVAHVEGGAEAEALRAARVAA